MPRNINLILVRHAVSEANLDNTVNARLPDNRVPLAPTGAAQAIAAGMTIADFLERNSGRTRILCSPYQRTRETSIAIEECLLQGDLSFDKREEIALREISFGLFDGISDEELPEVFPREHAHYQKHIDFEGEFYAPMPLGESRAQVADRVKGVFGTIIRDNSHFENPIRNFIIVSHGVTIRAFIMQWMHNTPEWYSKQLNPGNAGVTVISSDGKEPYHTTTLFEGFRHIRNKQEQREEGKI